MMKIPAFTVLLFTMLSCQQENPDNPTPTTCTEPVAYLKYKFDGTLIEMNGSLSQNSREGSLIRKEQRNTTTGTILTSNTYLYSILATKNYYYSDDGEPIIEIEINTPALSATTYPTSSIDLVQTYYPLQSNHCGSPCSPGSTSFTVTITKILNGFADGIFSGMVKNSGSTVLNQITEGEFRNVKIIQ